MRLAVVLLVLAGGAVGCGDDDDASLTSSAEYAARKFLTSYGFSESQVSCVVDALTDRIGPDGVADVTRGHVEESDEEGTGEALARSMAQCGGINPEHTACFGIFDSRPAARQAADRAPSGGFDHAEVGTGSDRHGPAPAVTFISGKTDAAARRLQDRFPRFIERMNGNLGHPGTGCLEQPFFGA